MVWLTPFTIVLIFFLLLSLSYLFTNYKEERREKKTKKEKEKKTLKTHRSSNDDITGIVEKISIR
jgi:Ca2+/Na+ antiporter